MGILRRDSCKAPRIRATKGSQMNLNSDVLPVLRHYLGQLDQLLRIDGVGEALDTRLSKDALSAGEHLRTAQGFALRTLLPPLGQKVPSLGTENCDLAGLRQRSKEVAHILHHLEHEDLTAVQPVQHKAGFAELTQSSSDYVMMFGLPNFMFHFATAHACLRSTGLDIGKAHFDGLHDYPAGFSWVPKTV